MSVGQPTDSRPLSEHVLDVFRRPEEWWQIVRETYLRFDRRTLGFTRILLGFLLVTDLLRRTWDWEDMYSTLGVLPTHVNLWRPQAHGAFSIFNAFSTPGELWVLWGVMMATFSCVMVGYKTRIAHVLSVFFVASMDGRVLLIENGGYVVYNLLVMWTAFLPMGDRFSVDALLESMRRRRERTDAELNDRSELIPSHKLAPHYSFLGFVWVIQLSAIYYFNVVHKTGPAWRNGTAVHYVLYVDRMVTPIIGHVREHIPNFMLLAMTKTTLAFEAAIPVCLLSPIGRAWARRAAIAMINALHLGFGVAMVLGPFAWACCVLSTLGFTEADWQIATRTMRRAQRARTVVYDRNSPLSLFVCRVLARLDRYQLLTFRAEDDVATGIRVEDAASKATTRALALADIVAALPLGPAVAWLVRLGGVRHAIDAIWTSLEQRDLSGFFGLRRPAPSETRPVARPDPRVLEPYSFRFFVVGGLLAFSWIVLERASFTKPELIVLLGGSGLVVAIATLRLVYRAARAIDDGKLSPSPRATVLLLLLPGVNVVAWLVLVRRWTAQYAAHAKRRGLDVPRPSPGVFSLYSVLAFVPGLNLLVAWIAIGDVCKHVNALTGLVPTVHASRVRLVTGLREFAIACMFAGAINQALVELWVVNRRIKVPQPEPTRLLSHKLRYLQGWFMFSPNPVMDDGTIIVDALTVDGRHIDPFTGKEPQFEIADAKSFRHNQIWCDYFNRMHLPANTAYREAMKEYMYRLPQRTGRADDAIVSGDVYWVQDMNPKWNDTKSYKYEKVKLFSFENKALAAQRAAQQRERDEPQPVPTATPDEGARSPSLGQ